MNRFLSLMWSHYDPENLGTMDYQHLQELMTHYTGHVLDEDLQAEFNVFVTMLDQDKSGYLDRTEVSNFITFGLPLGDSGFSIEMYALKPCRP